LLFVGHRRRREEVNQKASRPWRSVPHPTASRTAAKISTNRPPVVADDFATRSKAVQKIGQPPMAIGSSPDGVMDGGQNLHGVRATAGRAAN
jgi:hypothetical protein